VDVSLASEKIFSLGSIGITNSILTGWLVTLFLLVGGFLVRRILAHIPGKVQAALELIYEYFYATAIDIVGQEAIVREIFPFIMSLFFFILVSNWAGLLPAFGSIGFHEIKAGKEVLVPLFRAPTSDLNTTLALALLTMLYIQFLAVKHTGIKSYLSKFFNFRNPISFFVGLVEIVSESMRILSFGFRLFGNVFAGEVLMAVMFFLTTSLVPYIAVLPLPFFLLELFVGVIQAFIFCFLMIVFTSLAVSGHDDEEHGHPVEVQASEEAIKAGHELAHTLLHPQTNPNHTEAL
jgi:F-type H+-transporting ATPase subunit a